MKKSKYEPFFHCFIACNYYYIVTILISATFWAVMLIRGEALMSIWILIGEVLI